VIEREENRKLKEKVAKLEKEKAENAARQKEKEEKDKIAERMKKSLNASASSSSQSAGKRKKDDSDSEVDDDGKEPTSLASKMMANKKAKTVAQPPASASKITPSDVKKAEAAPKKADVPVDAVKKTIATAAATATPITGAAAKTKKFRVGDSFRFQGSDYLLTHYEETTTKPRKADEDDDAWIRRHPINQLSTCLRIGVDESFSDLRKSLRSLLEHTPNAKPKEEDLDSDGILPLGMRTGDAQAFFFCVVPAVGPPAVMLNGAKTWEVHWEAEKGDGKPKLDNREYDSKVTGAGKKVGYSTVHPRSAWPRLICSIRLSVFQGKGKIVYKPWHVFNISTNVFDDKGTPFAKLILHPDIAKARFRKNLKRRESSKRRKDKKAREGDDSGAEEGDEDDEDNDEEEEKEEKPKAAKPKPPTPAPSDNAVAYAVVNDSDRVISELKGSIQELSDRVTDALSRMNGNITEFDKTLLGVKDDLGCLNERIVTQSKTLTKWACEGLPKSISLTPLPSEKKAAAAVAKKQQTEAEQIDAAVKGMTSKLPQEDLKALEEALEKEDSGEFSQP